jgi:hypothetical protein
LTLREKHRLRVFENRELRKMFGPRGMKWWEVREKFIMKGFITCTVRQVSLED